MSDFAVTVEPAVLTEHPNADRLYLAHVKGWQCVTAKEGWDTDRGAYVPLDAIVPTEKLQEWGLEGRLGGKNKNIVKTIRLRGEVSQGLFIPVSQDIPLGTDLTDVWRITKHEPEIPTFLNGGGSNYVTRAWPHSLSIYDIQRIENYPDVLTPGTTVVVTEKLDGTNLALTFQWDGQTFQPSACSRHIAYDVDATENDSVLYVHVARPLIPVIQDWITTYTTMVDPHLVSITVRGEILGPGIQGNKYKLMEPALYLFDVELNGRAVDHHMIQRFAQDFRIPMVPILYEGPFPEDHRPISYGQSMLNQHILREGAVWRTLNETSHPKLGRVILKAVDPNWLLKEK